MQVRNRLLELRKQKGLSAALLARQAGVSRQTIYAIETGAYIPNTAVSLRLAQALETAVEQIFSIEVAKSPEDTLQTAELLATEKVHVGQPMRLCRVGKRLVAVSAPPLPSTLPLADGTWVAGMGRKKVKIKCVAPGSDLPERLLLAGCDPAGSILARHLERHAGIQLVLVNCSSTQALQWVASGKVHLAGSHLGERMTEAAKQRLLKTGAPGRGYEVVRFAIWEQGLVLARGNPKGIRGIGDLARKDVKLVNREKGAGSRFLLDRLLKEQEITAARISGYDRIAFGHISAAWHVHAGIADCCVATRAAARAFGLEFLPLITERYDLIIPESQREMKPVQALRDVLNRAAFQREVEAIADYDMKDAGKTVSVKPLPQALHRP